ncbi:B3 domain-containing protein [Canna indica]|uniref:B3 domain-containing protein n=1 Tax=Canna indica TaxID=4628 RepID=A0AAQ3K087_9LILI|nr:B3 domain-containing protein [Canna indica]
MAGDFSQRMNVPNNFFKNFKGQISEIVTLKGPCGNTWKVRSTKSETCLSFQNGWNDFVKAHHIQESDILIFRYDGDSCFDVLIFDEDGCEKTSSVVLRSINLHMQKKTDDSSKEAEHSSSTSLYINLSESQGERFCCKSPKTCKLASKVHCIALVQSLVVEILGQ